MARQHKQDKKRSAIYEQNIIKYIKTKKIFNKKIRLNEEQKKNRQETSRVKKQNQGKYENIVLNIVMKFHKKYLILK